LRELDAARIAAPADQHLGLHDDRVAELLGGLDRLLHGHCRPAFRHRHSVLLEELFALILEKVHEKPRMSRPRVAPSGRGAAPYRIETRSLGDTWRYPKAFASSLSTATAP